MLAQEWEVLGVGINLVDSFKPTSSVIKARDKRKILISKFNALSIVDY